MAYRLRNRQTGIPQAVRFHQPELNWSNRPGSFENIVGQIIRVRLANPQQTAKHGWATDPEAVANELDSYLAKICLDNGWHKFVQSGEGDIPPPRSARPGLNTRLGNVAAGGSVIVETILKDEAVAPELAEHRAGVCAVCPLNQTGDMLSFFTVPVSNAIRSALSLFRGWRLETTWDDKLGVCQACDCPLKLKVHFPIARIHAKLPQEARARLDAKCWIPQETTERMLNEPS